MFAAQTSESVLWHPSTVACQSDQTADSGQWTALGLRHLPLGHWASVANPEFINKKPSQNAGKNGKVMQGNASVFDTPPGGRAKNRRASLPALYHKPLPKRYFLQFKTQNSTLKTIEIYPKKYAIYERFSSTPFYQ